MPRVAPPDGGQDAPRAHLSRDVLATLDSIAMNFLHTRGIADEPLRWTPPTTLLDGLDLPGVTANTSHLELIQDFVDRGSRTAWKLRSA